MIGALAGLVNNNMRRRGDFDAWLADPEAGGKLGLSDLDLTQSRNHILDAAIEALPAPDKRLLQTLSLLNGADYEALRAFNPHLPPKPEEPEDPKIKVGWFGKSGAERRSAISRYESELREFGVALRRWEKDAKAQGASSFDRTLRNLERRGLLQYDHGLEIYDLHPVVRGVASGRLNAADAKAIGEGVADYLSTKPHPPWEQASTLKDVEPGIQLVQTLTRIGDFDRAFDALAGDLANALMFNLMAHTSLQQLLRPFFTNGWNAGPELESPRAQSYVLAVAAIGLLFADDLSLAMEVRAKALWLSFGEGDVLNTVTDLRVLSSILRQQGNFAAGDKLGGLARELAEADGGEIVMFLTLVDLYQSAVRYGDARKAVAVRERIGRMSHDAPRSSYRVGDLETVDAYALFSRGDLTDAELTQTEALCRGANNREGLCRCLLVRGEWRLSQGEYQLAVESLNEALRLYREAGIDDTDAEPMLVLAKLRLGEPVEARGVAIRHGPTLSVARIWQELGETDQAVEVALATHKRACGSGEPFVSRFLLERASALLEELGQTPPEVPDHDPTQVEMFEWEDDLRAMIEETRRDRARGPNE